MACSCACTSFSCDASPAWPRARPVLWSSASERPQGCTAGPTRPQLCPSPEGRRVQERGRLEPHVVPLPGPILTTLPVPSRRTASPRASPARPAGVCGWGALSTKENGRAVGGGAPRSSAGSCSAEPGAAVPVLCGRESSSAREGVSISSVYACCIRRKTARACGSPGFFSGCQISDCVWKARLISSGLEVGPRWKESKPWILERIV